MQFFNNNKYAATQDTPTSYSLTLESGFEAVPDNTKSAVMTLLDDAMKSVRVRADIASNTLDIVEVFSSTESGNAIPTFGTGLKALSSDVAEALGRPLQTAGLIFAGQSNVVAPNTGKTALDALYFNEYDNRIKQSTFNQASRNTDYHTAYAIEPLFNQTIGLVTNLGCAIPFAQEILKEGWNDVVIIPHGANSTQISYFNKPSAPYDKIKDSIIEFINDNPNHRVAAWVHMQGESDSFFGTTTADDYRDANKALRDNVASDVLLATGYDMNRVPYLATELGPDAVTNYGAHTNVIIAGIQDIPTVMPFSATIPIPADASRNGSSNEGGSTDLAHYSAEFQFRLGSILLPTALATARQHFTASGVGLTLNSTAPAMSLSGSTASLFTNEPLELTATAPSMSLSGSSASLDDGLAIIELNVTAAPSMLLSGSSASLETTSAPAGTPLTDALTPDLQIRYEVGITTDGGNNVTAIVDQSAHARTIALPTAPSSTGTGLLFDAANEEYITVAGVTGNGTAGTWIFEYQGTAGVLASDGTTAFNSRIVLDDNNVWLKTAALFANSEAIVSPDLDDGVKRVIAMTVDGTNFKVFAGSAGSLSEVHTETSGAIHTNTADINIGRMAYTAATYFDGTLFNVVLKEATAWTVSQINDVTGEFAS